jgi:type II secretory pathway pseudopilin PulG
MESLIAVGAVLTVVGAFGAILMHVMLGDTQKRRLEKLRDELRAQGSADKGA